MSEKFSELPFRRFQGFDLYIKNHGHSVT